MSLLLRSNRNNLFRLASTATGTTGGAATAFVKPAVAVWSGRVPRSFSSMNPKRHVDDTGNNSSSMDESDQLEIGKTTKREVSNNKDVQKEVATKSNSLLANRHPFFREFDDFFARDPFFEPFHSLDPLFHRRSLVADRIFDRMLNNMSLLNDPLPTARTRIGGRKSATPALLRSSPAYEIKEKDDVYEITVQIPKGMEASDLNVEMDDDNDVIHISGTRKESKGKNDEASESGEEGTDNKPQTKMMSETRFDKWFRMDGEIVDREQMEANFADGVLALKVPKKVDDAKPKKTKITITENPHQTEEEVEVKANVVTDEVKDKTFSDEFDESDWAETGKSNPHPESLKM